MSALVDIEKVVVDALSTGIPALATVGQVDHVITEDRLDLESIAPVVIVRKLPGTRINTGVVDVDTFAFGRTAAHDLAAEVERFLLATWRRTAYGKIDYATLGSTFAPGFYPDSDLTRYHASYEIVARP